jgi:molecular chaperone IbpA
MFTEHMYRHAIGLDNLFKKLTVLQGSSDKGNFPPHRVSDIEDKTYYLEFAVAGYSKEDLEVVLEDSETLVVQSSGSSTQKTGDNTNGELYTSYDGIASRGFKKEFKLNPYLKVKNVTLKDGLLTIELEKTLPEEKKLKVLTIN